MIENVPEEMRLAFEVADELWPGWERALNCDTLIMSDGCNCVAGQLERGRLGLPTNCVIEHQDFRSLDIQYTWWVAQGKVGVEDSIGAFTRDDAFPYWKAEQKRRLALDVRNVTATPPY